MRIEAIKRRAYWVAELEKISGAFGNAVAKMISELQDEILRGGIDAFLDHLRICGAMPECYGHDSSAEKLYSKYTDAVISEAFATIGLNSSLINARVGTADVQARASSFSLFADAKDEALTYLRLERNRLLGLSHKKALAELLRTVGLDSRIEQIEKLQHGDLLGALSNEP